MNPKTTIVLLALMVVGVVVFLVVGPAPGPESDATEPVFPGFVSADVSRVAWSVGGEEVRVRRADGQFEVAVGDGWDVAESGRVEELLTDLEAMDRRSVIEASGVDAQARQDYGLDPALGWISVTLRGEERRLSIGRKSMTRDTVYAQRGDGEDVLVVDDAAWETVLGLGKDQLRQRRLVPWIEGDVDRIAVRRDGEVKLAGRRVERLFWRATAPFDDYLHPKRFGSQLFHEISSLEAEEFVREAPSDEELAGFGLASPRYAIEVHRFRGADETATVLIGDPVEDREGYFHLRRADRPAVAIGRAGKLVDLLEKEPEWYRDPGVTRLQFTPVNGIVSTVDGVSFRAVFTEDEWRLTEPEARVLQAEKVGDWIDSLREIDAAGFVDDPDLAALGLGEDAGRLRLLPAPSRAGGHEHGDDEGEEGEETAENVDPILDLRISAPDDEGYRHVLRAGNEGVAYRVGPGFGELVSGGFWRFVPPAIFPDAPDGAEVVGFSRRRADEVLDLEKEDGAWPVEPEVDETTLGAAVSRLLGLYAVRWVGPTGERLDEYGLGDGAFARVEATFRVGESDRRLGVEIGAETEGGRFARPVYDAGPGEGVFVIAPADVERLLVPVVK